MTNGDMICSMKDENLAAFLTKYLEMFAASICADVPKTHYETTLAFLKKESE